MKRKILMIGISISVLILFLSSCASIQPKQSKSNINFVLYDKDKKPITGATTASIVDDIPEIEYISINGYVKNTGNVDLKQTYFQYMFFDTENSESVTLMYSIMKDTISDLYYPSVPELCCIECGALIGVPLEEGVGWNQCYLGLFRINDRLDFETDLISTEEILGNNNKVSMLLRFSLSGKYGVEAKQDYSASIIEKTITIERAIPSVEISIS